jgi:hypothetical protein
MAALAATKLGIIVWAQLDLREVAAQEKFWSTSGGDCPLVSMLCHPRV